jgi:hypothetical protein
VKPCGESWEAMGGGSRVRHCGSCDRDVLNVAAMTAGQLEAVIAEGSRTGAMPCMRVVRDADGLLMVAQEVVQPKWYQRVAAGVAGAMLSGLAAAAQDVKPEAQARLSGHLVDTSGASIPRASVSLRREDGMVFRATTDGAGQFVVDAAPGTYEMDADSAGFKHYAQKAVVLQAGEQVLGEDVRLQVGESFYSGPVVVDQPKMSVELRSTTSLLDPLLVAHGDARMSELLGRVVDLSRTPIPGATVELHHGEDVFSAKTDDRGVFAVRAPAGDYEVSATMAGFATAGPGRVRLERGVRELDKPILLNVGMIEMGDVVSVPLKTHRGKAKPVVAAGAAVEKPAATSSAGRTVSVTLGQAAVTASGNDMPLEGRGTASLLTVQGTPPASLPASIAAPASRSTPAPR